MTVPQHDAAPYRQQRWIELENVGTTPIPPYAAVEIVNSYRPEPIHYTPDDGRTVLRVRLSTKDNPCPTIINGPCVIPIGEYARVGTIDDPMLAQVASYLYTPGTVVGVKRGSYLLTSGYCGYLILGDYDAASNTMRVKRWEDCPSEMMVKADECIYPGDSTKKASPMKWNGTTKCWEADENAAKVTICDCNKWLLALPGECFKVERLNSCDSGGGDDTCYRPSFPFGLTRRVKIESPIYCGECGTARIVKTGNNAADCEYPELSDCEIEVCNTTGRKLGCDADEYATLHISPGECGTGTKPTCYGWLVEPVRARRAKAILNKKMCAGQAEFDKIEQYLDLCEWTPREEPTTAANPYGLMGCSGDEIELAWNDPNCAWDVVQVKHYTVDPFIQNFGCGGDCTMTATVLKKPLAIQQCEECGQSDTMDVLTADWVEVVDDLESGTAGTTGQTVLTGMTEDISGGGSEGSEGGKCEYTFSSANLTSTSVTVKRKKICVFCAGEDTAEDGSSFSILDIGSAGDDAKITATEVTAIHDVELNCEPCPELQAKGQTFWALCVTAADTEWADATGTCDCIDCEDASA